MRVAGRGILPLSEHFLLEPSPLARRLLYYAVAAGSFSCGPGYDVERASHDSFLLIAVKAGTLYVGFPGDERTVRKGDVYLLDCHVPHRYRVRDACSFAFLHFDGANARDIYESVRESSGCLCAGSASGSVTLYLDRLLEELRKDAPRTEYERSGDLHALLCALLEGALGEGGGAADAAKRFFAAHYAHAVSVSDAARAAGLSEAHFSRLFRRQTGLSPYQYLIRLRVSRAKEILRAPGSSVKRAALECGFASESNFISAFTRIAGMTPGEYRSAPL